MRAGKGAVTVLLATTYQWFKMIEGRNDVPHSPLLTKLLCLDLDANIVENYLTFRHQKFAVNETTCDCTAVVWSPAGFVLGPLLVLVYVDDLASPSVSVGTQRILHADDLL